MLTRLLRLSLVIACFIGLAAFVQAPAVRAQEGQGEEGKESFTVFPLKTIAECQGCAAQTTQLNGIPLFFSAPIRGQFASPVNFNTRYGAPLQVAAPTRINAYGKALVFKHWRSVTDNKTLTTNATLVGYVNKPETLAAVYQAQPVGQPLTLDLKGECENCNFNVGVAGLSVPLSTMQGGKTTPTQLTVPANSQIVFSAPSYVMVQGHLLQFRAWRSVTDNRVLTTSRTLAGIADKTETLAVVYREVPYFKGWEDAPLESDQ